MGADVEGIAEGSPGDPRGTCADDPANRVCDPGHQEGTRVSGKDTHVRISPISGEMRMRTAPISEAVCTHTSPSNAWTVVSRKGTRVSRPICRKCSGDKKSPEHAKFAHRVRRCGVGSWSYAEAVSGGNRADYLLTTF
jgi:hypothetical protein